MKKATIITGVAGTTGSTVLDLMSDGFDVKCGDRILVGIDNLFRGVVENIQRHLDKDYFFFIKDNYQNLTKLCKGEGQAVVEISEERYQVDEIIHMAAVVPTKYFYEAPELTFRENCLGTVDLFNWAIEHNIEKFIVGSTSEVYGHISDKCLPVKEDEMSHFDSVETTPRWSYAEGKLLTEHILNKSKDKIKVCHLRFANTYGVRDMDDNHIIPYLVNSIVNNRDIRINKDPDNFYRTFLNNYDAAEAVLAVSRNGTSGTAYNVGSSQEVSISALVNLVMILCEGFTGEKYTGKILKEIERSGDPRRRILCTDRLYKDTSFTPSVELVKGITEMIGYAISQKEDNE